MTCPRCNISCTDLTAHGLSCVRPDLNVHRLSIKVKRKGTKFTTFAFNGKHCVGRAVMTICVFDANTAAIMDLFVRPEFRSKGYGTLLVEDSLRRALSFSNIRRVLIQDGSEHNETGKIARKLGFMENNKVWVFHV